MRADRLPAALAAAAVTATAAVAVWGVVVVPDARLRFVLVATLLPALWAYVELAQVRGADASVADAIMKLHRYCFAWAGVMLASRIGLRLAIHTGLLGPSWLEPGRRFSGLVLAIGMIAFGNYLPTLRSPWPLHRQPFAWQQVHRFVGWVFVLSGLAVAACWLWLDASAASHASMRILAVTVVLCLGRKLASLLSPTPPRPLLR
jgi:hypothetical protein